MIELRCFVAGELAGSLEEHFCELEISPWMLMRKPRGDRVSLSGFFDTEADALRTWGALRKDFPALPEQPDLHALHDRDWKEAYKEHFKPWSDRGLHWVPLWEKENYPLPAGDSVVYLDPGMAFGTGGHPTTRLCAGRLLDFRDAWQPDLAQCSVIDAGCGSGILAISALRLGCGSVFAFDNDPEAVRVSRENLEVNGAGGNISFETADIRDALNNRRAGLILANIQADILCANAELLLRAVKPGGVLALSGILVRELESVKKLFDAVARQNRGAFRLDSRIEGEWSDLRLRFGS